MSTSDFLQSWGLILLAAVLNSYTSVVVKYRFNKLGQMDLGSIRNLLLYLLKFFKSFVIWSAVAATIFAPFLFFTALYKFQLSIGYPIFCSLQLFFSVVSGIVILKENVNLYKIAGVLLLFISLYLFYSV